MKIVSLLPSATEIICALGLSDSLVGVTHECDFPDQVKGLPKVTKTIIPVDATSGEIDALVRERLNTKLALYSLDMDVLHRLMPDLLVTQALCDVCAVAEAEVMHAACMLPGHPKVLNLEPMSLEEVFDTISVVGKATGLESKALGVVGELRQRTNRIKCVTDKLLRSERPRVAFIEWIDPLFNAGHWTPSLVEMAGGIDILGTPGAPSRRISWNDVVSAQPDVIFIACCGFSAERTRLDLPLLSAHSGWAELECVRNGRVYVTDGNAYFSRPGPRLVDGLEILAHALHPNLVPLPVGLLPAVQPF